MKEKELIKRKSSSNKTGIKYYAYFNYIKKTWFITKLNIIDSESILLFILLCIKTDNPLFFPDKTTPVIGTILSSTTGDKLEVVHCESV